MFRENTTRCKLISTLKNNNESIGENFKEKNMIVSYNRKQKISGMSDKYEGVDKIISTLDVYGIFINQ